MRFTRRFALSALLVFALLASGCGCDSECGDCAEEGEESGTELALDAKYDRIRNGARLVLAYAADKNAFVGTVSNATDKPLERVRVEVHLSNGRELGPTKPTDLAPGQSIDVLLEAESKGFTGWTAHPEVGNEEHGHGGEHGGEHRGEHDREGGGEHGGESRDEHDSERSGEHR